MHPTFLTTALGRRGGRVLAVTLAAAAGITCVLANGAQAAQVPPRCEIVACPDLVITRVERASIDVTYATVRNIGTRRAAVLSNLYIDGYGPAGSAVPPLNPGESYRAKLHKARPMVWRRVADGENRVAESNEQNNSFTFTW
jgi:hypothetical protein